MANNSTLNELVKLFSDLADAHLQINDFGFGPTNEIGESRKMNYPYLWVSVADGTSVVQGDLGGGYSYIDFQISVIVADKVNDIINEDNLLGEKSNNGLEVSSDTLQIINDIIARISQHPYYNKNKIRLIGDLSINPAFDDDDGRVNAWSADITIRMPFRLTYCGAPFSDLSLVDLPEDVVPILTPFCEAVSSCQSIIDIQSFVDDKTFYIGLNFENVETWNYRAPENFKINTVDNIDGLSYSLYLEGSSYTLGATISQFDSFSASVNTPGFLKLNSEII